MSYCLVNAELRIISVDASGRLEIGEAFTPRDWLCDPCAPATRRYLVEGAEYPWYSVIVPGDDPEHIVSKCRTAQQLYQLQVERGELSEKLRRLR